MAQHIGLLSQQLHWPMAPICWQMLVIQEQIQRENLTYKDTGKRKQDEIQA